MKIFFIFLFIVSLIHAENEVKSLVVEGAAVNDMKTEILQKDKEVKEPKSLFL